MLKLSYADTRGMLNEPVRDFTSRVSTCFMIVVTLEPLQCTVSKSIVLLALKLTVLNIVGWLNSYLLYYRKTKPGSMFEYQY